jgi:hypothetical protein
MKVIKRKNLLPRNKKLTVLCPIKLIENPKTCDWNGYSCYEGCKYDCRGTRTTV